MGKVQLKQKSTTRTPKTSTLKKSSGLKAGSAVDLNSKKDSTKKKRNITLRLNLKNHCGGFWWHQCWYLRWIGDKSDESLRAMHMFHDKLVTMEHAPKIIYNVISEKEEERSRQWKINSSDIKTPAAIPGRVRQWNGTMVWELYCIRNPQEIPAADLNKEFSKLLKSIKEMMEEHNLQRETWRYSEIFDKDYSDNPEDWHSNNPEDWKKRREYVNDAGYGPLEDVLSGKYLYY